MTRSRYRFGDDHYPHFMTSTIVAWLPVFSQPEFANVVLDSWRFLQREREIDILAFVIMENHLHWIGVGPQLAKRVGEFKSFTATTMIKAMQEKRYALRRRPRDPLHDECHGCLASSRSPFTEVSRTIENAQLYRELREADQRKDEFLATLAHELRNPLAPIRNGLQVLRSAGTSGGMVDEARSMMERQPARWSASWTISST